MANAVNLDSDYGDMRAYDITWDTDLTVNKYFSLDAHVTPYVFDFSRYNYIRIIPYQHTGTIASAAYIFAPAESGVIGTYAPVLIPAEAGFCKYVSVGTGTPGASTKTAGYVQAPVRRMGLLIQTAGTALTEIRFQIVGYKVRSLA